LSVIYYKSGVWRRRSSRRRQGVLWAWWFGELITKLMHFKHVLAKIFPKNFRNGGGKKKKKKKKKKKNQKIS